MGDICFDRPIDACNANDCMGRQDLTQQFEEIKSKFVVLVESYPLKKKSGDRFCELGSISNPICYRMVSDILKAQQGLLVKFKEACCTLRILWKHCNLQNAILSNRMVILFRDLYTRYEGFDSLYSVCKKIIKDQGFFQARVQFHKNMTLHGEMMETVSQIRKDLVTLKMEIASSLGIVLVADRMSGFMTIMYQYITFISTRDDIKCKLETIFNPKHLCAGHPHSQIKQEYQRVVMQLETPPNGEEVLLNAKMILDGIKTIKEKCDIADEILAETYKGSLFRVQKWIHGYISKREAKLGEGIVTD